MVTDYNAATLRRLTELLENSLCNILDEQLSLAAQWARQSDPLVMELTQRLLDQEEALIPFFSPENRLTYAQYVEICRRNWDACLRRQWLSGFWGEEPSSFPLQPGWQKDFPALSPSGASALAAVRQTEQRLFLTQAPYFRQAGRRLSPLVAGPT